MQEMAEQQESVECKTLAKFVRKLIIAFKCSPISISTDLFAKGLISEELLDKVITSGISNESKAAELVMSVVDQVRLNPQKYHEFMDLESFKQPCLKSVHNVITKEYGNLS